jgi:hypothetical protein
VIKPAPNTGFNPTRFGRVITEKTGIAAGVVNVVTTGNLVSAQLEPKGW